MIDKMGCKFPTPLVKVRLVHFNNDGRPVSEPNGVREHEAYLQQQRIRSEQQKDRREQQRAHRAQATSVEEALVPLPLGVVLKMVQES